MRYNYTSSTLSLSSIHLLVFTVRRVRFGLPFPETGTGTLTSLFTIRYLNCSKRDITDNGNDSRQL